MSAANFLFTFTLLLCLGSNPCFASPLFWWDLFLPRRAPCEKALLPERQRAVPANDYVASTLFILPDNDGESARALEILREMNAPFVQVSRQRWGASIDNEPKPLRLPDDVIRVVIFEMPGLLGEQHFRDLKREVVIVDHHGSAEFPDRYRTTSSLEQLAGLIGYPLKEFDTWLAVNDRGFIRGLKSLGLTTDQIRSVRNYDLRAQGYSQAAIKQRIKQARSLIPFLDRRNGLVEFHGEMPDPLILEQELALSNPDGLANMASFYQGVRFSGSSVIVENLARLDLTAFGLNPSDFDMYHGGDRDIGTMFFRLRPKTNQPLPAELEKKLREIIFAGKSPAPPNLVVAETISYSTFGHRKNPAVVLIHDETTTQETFGLVAQRLSKKFFVITYDLRGFGRSANLGPIYNSQIFSGDLKLLLNHLKVPKANILGYANGARIAVRFAAENRDMVESLILDSMHVLRGIEINKSTTRRLARTLEAVPEGQQTSFIVHSNLYREDLCSELGTFSLNGRVLLMRAKGDPLLADDVMDKMRDCSPDLRVSQSPRSGDLHLQDPAWWTQQIFEFIDLKGDKK